MANVRIFTKLILIFKFIIHQSMLYFNNTRPKELDFWKHFGKKENAGYQHFLPFPTLFPTLLKTNPFSNTASNPIKTNQHINHLPHMPNLGSSNSAANKDMMSKIQINGETIIWLSRKHCGKRRNCSLRAISPFPTRFQKLSSVHTPKWLSME